jgi:LPS O-antigen subunit length determinant protein (WzzB/FepE family)
MFSEVRDEYVFRTIDPAVIPEEKFKPKRALICIFMTLIGGVVGDGLVFLNYILRRGNSVSPRHFEVK